MHGVHNQASALFRAVRASLSHVIPKYVARAGTSSLAAGVPSDISACTLRVIMAAVSFREIRIKQNSENLHDDGDRFTGQQSCRNYERDAEIRG